MTAVPSSLPDLVSLLDLEQIEVDLYRGPSPETTRQRVFGGQVAGQALVAAGRTVVAERMVHSLHAYFLRPGDPGTQIVYHVDRVRDGRSFSTRRVVATQHGKAIFTMSASFQVHEEGLEHQETMPAAPEPESLRSLQERLDTGDGGYGPWWREFGSLDVRHVADGPSGEKPAASSDTGHAARSQVWLRAAGALPDDPLLHVCVLAYLSDLTLLAVALVPHGMPGVESMEGASVQMASLDHAMWFHRPFRADEWLLYDQDSPSATGGRGLATGRIFTRAGALVASVVQEGLVRPLRG